MAARRLTSRSEINSNKEQLIKDLQRIYVRKYLAENGLINFDDEKENVEENINIENNKKTKKKKEQKKGNDGDPHDLIGRLGDENSSHYEAKGGKLK